MSISRDRAGDIINNFLVSHLTEIIRIENLISSDEDRFHLPTLYGIPEQQDGYWIAYLRYKYAPEVLGPSVVIILSQENGEVLYCGKTQDEG